MGLINRLNKKCIFCKSKHGELRYIPSYGMYGPRWAGKWYHEGCLEDVLCMPEKYEMRMASKALDLVQRIKEYDNDLIRRRELLSDACRYTKSIK